MNYSAIANDVGADLKTIKSYFDILTDTWMGHQVPAYHRTVRKAQRSHPKFYWFDVGVRRALEETLDMRPRPGTSYFGECFEQLVVNEIFRLNQYLERDYRLSYFQTQNSGAEIDLVLSKGSEGPILIEINSADRVEEREVAALERLAVDFKPSAIYYLSRDPLARTMGPIQCLFWQDGIRKIMRTPNIPALDGR